MKNQRYLIILFLTISCVSFFLGSWQVKRLKWKNNIIENINEQQQYQKLFPESYVEPLKLYQKVELQISCYWQHALQLMGKNINKTWGYYLYAPILLNKKFLFIEWGWFPEYITLKQAIKLSTVFRNVNIKGSILPLPTSTFFTPETINKQIYAFNIPKLEKTLNKKIHPYFIRTHSTLPNIQNIVHQANNITITNNHLEYAITWFILSLISFIFACSIYYRRRA